MDSRHCGLQHNTDVKTGVFLTRGYNLTVPSYKGLKIQLRVSCHTIGSLHRERTVADVDEVTSDAVTDGVRGLGVGVVAAIAPTADAAHPGGDGL